MTRWVERKIGFHEYLVSAWHFRKSVLISGVVKEQREMIGAFFLSACVGAISRVSIESSDPRRDLHVFYICHEDGDGI